MPWSCQPMSVQQRRFRTIWGPSHAETHRSARFCHARLVPFDIDWNAPSSIRSFSVLADASCRGCKPSCPLPEMFEPDCRDVLYVIARDAILNIMDELLIPLARPVGEHLHLPYVHHVNVPSGRLKTVKKRAA